MNRKLFTFVLIFIAIFTGLMSFPKPAFCKIPSVIETDKDAGAMLQKARQTLKGRLNMQLNQPVDVRLVTGQELDSIMKNSSYRGNIVGIHTMEDGRHVVYMMRGMGRDQFFGTLCHELTHGWQAENCPNQELALREGLAVWVEYKCLYFDGAYTLANRLNNNIADPVYGVGYRFIQSLEKKFGQGEVLEQVKKLKRIPDKF